MTPASLTARTIEMRQKMVPASDITPIMSLNLVYRAVVFSRQRQTFFCLASRKHRQVHGPAFEQRDYHVSVRLHDVPRRNDSGTNTTKRFLLGLFMHAVIASAVVNLEFNVIMSVNIVDSSLDGPWQA